MLFAGKRKRDPVATAGVRRLAAGRAGRRVRNSMQAQGEADAPGSYYRDVQGRIHVLI